MRVRFLVLAACSLAAAAASAHAQTALPADSLELARKYTQWFYTGRADSLVAHHDEASRKMLGAGERLQTMLLELTARAGTETEVLEEKFVTRNGRRQYWRTAKFSQFAEPVLLRWVLTPRGELAGIGLGPKSQAPPVDPRP